MLRSLASLRVLAHTTRPTLARPITTTAIKCVREIRINEDADQITIEGVPIESDRKENLVKLPKESHQFCNACPLCRLNLRRLNYSDVLILHQFIESNGRLMPREVTGLCHRSYAQVKKLVGQAQSARLLPRPPQYVSYGPWDDLNRYYEYPRRHRDQPIRVIRKEYWDGAMK